MIGYLFFIVGWICFSVDVLGWMFPEWMFPGLIVVGCICKGGYDWVDIIWWILLGGYHWVDICWWMFVWWIYVWWIVFSGWCSVFVSVRVGLSWVDFLVVDLLRWICYWWVFLWLCFFSWWICLLVAFMFVDFVGWTFGCMCLFVVVSRDGFLVGLDSSGVTFWGWICLGLFSWVDLFEADLFW